MLLQRGCGCGLWWMGFVSIGEMSVSDADGERSDSMDTTDSRWM